jgi:hypothetical protein
VCASNKELRRKQEGQLSVFFVLPGASAIIAVLGSGQMVEAGYYYVLTTVAGALVMLAVALVVNNLPRPANLRSVTPHKHAHSRAFAGATAGSPLAWQIPAVLVLTASARHRAHWGKGK